MLFINLFSHFRWLCWVKDYLPSKYSIFELLWTLKGGRLNRIWNPSSNKTVSLDFWPQHNLVHFTPIHFNACCVCYWALYKLTWCTNNNTSFIWFNICIKNYQNRTQDICKIHTIANSGSLIYFCKGKKKWKQLRLVGTI